ncbi:MAG TPA: glutamate--tRNA ligase [Candidatus Omnitrophota bacterium]|nr:glutamate--tRNA ligase [Candidatus Omnitrophota bacterium]
MMRVRFAPSPTGYLHIGGARTCLFNWLYARAKGGQFILRIEDTDVARSRKEYLDEILDSLKWLGLNWDELHYQSERFDKYRQYAKKLLDEGKAYLAEDGSGAIIARMPQKTVQIDDMIHGPIQFDTGLIKDQVLIKTDQSPTYNFACVIDDSEMNITHIIRGDDHISNTPKQIVLYEALGFPLPKFAHIPMILGKGGGRMSKRAGATAITEYRRMGFVADALVNYLMLLGWSLGNNQEIISLKEAIEKFDIVSANKTAATFDMDKLTWLNSQYIKAKPLDEMAELLKPFLEERNFIGSDHFDKNVLADILKLYRERATTLVEFADSLKPFFAEDVEIPQEARVKFFSCDMTKEFSLLKDKFNSVAEFNAQKIEEAFRQTVSELGITAKQLIHPLRVALSGRTVGPGMFEFIEVLGKERTLKRIESIITSFQK